MRGTILSGGDSGGMLSAEDGNRYQFEADAWQGADLPRLGDAADFTADNGVARQVYPLAAALPMQVNMVGALNPLRKIYKFVGTGLIVLGVVLTLTIIGAFVGIPLIIIGLLLRFVAPKFVSGIENSAGTMIDRARVGRP